MWSFPSLEERRRSCSESSLRGSISDLAPYDIPEVVGTASELLFNRMLTLGTCVDVKQKAYLFKFEHRPRLYPLIHLAAKRSKRIPRRQI
jgi:hypothetical protein